jgi:hypothetical protein
MQGALGHIETRFNAWVELDPHMSADERQYLEVHASCALGLVADQLKSHMIPVIDGTVACLQHRNYMPTDLADFVDPNMALAEFMRGSIKMSQTWLQELAKRRPNRRQLAWAARKLFQNNDAGWQQYVAHIRKSAPWFDAPSLDRDDDFRPRGGRLAMLLHTLLAD